MKVSIKYLIPALLAAFLLSACGEKEASAPGESMPEVAAPAAEEAAPAAEEAAPAAEEAAPASSEPGGYVPTPDELVPGETRPAS